MHGHGGFTTLRSLEFDFRLIILQTQRLRLLLHE